MNTKLKKRVQVSCMASAWLLTAWVLVVDPGRAALPEGRSLDILSQGTNISLSWLSITNAPYDVLAKTNLGQGSWGVLDTIVNAGGVTVYPVTPDDSPSRFFSLLFPKPVVTAGEPARFAHGTGGSYLYITGAYFYSGDQIRVGGILADNAVFLSSSLLRVELPPGLPPGVHDVELLSGHGGAVIAMLHEAVTVLDPLVDSDRLLYGPPEAPLASPMGLWLSKKGYDYYKAASDNAVAAASPETDTFTDEYIKKMIIKAAFFGPPDNGKGINEKGIKIFDDAGVVASSVVEGKKGLNAVNVKLARMAASSNIGSSGQDGVEVSLSRRLPISNLGSSGQDGVEVSLSSGRRRGNLGSVGEDGVSNIGSSGQDGVSLFSGEVQQQVVDLAIEGRGLDFVWARTYHSRIGRTGASSNGWTFSYDVRCAQNSSGGVDVYDGTGRKDTLNLQTNGVYACPELFREGTLVGDVFRLTFADTGYWEFRALTSATAPGKLDRIVDRNGNTVSLSYDTAGRLVEVVDTLGRACTVAYDTAGRLASVSDFTGRTVSYEYDAHGDLVACISPPVIDTPTGNDFPNGKTNSYTYSSGSTVEAENHLLTSCVDALGETVVACAYDLNSASASYLRCTSIQRGDHPPTMLTYQPQTPSPDNRFAAMRCVANDPVGNVNVVLYDCRNRGIEKAQIKRRAEPGTLVTDTSALPYDKLRLDDPDSTVTRWSWNNDSLCTAATAPGGQQIRCTYQGDIEPSTPARKRADCLEVREVASSAVDLDGDGTPDTSERVWHYAYDPRFGSDPTRKGWDGSVKGKKIQSWVKDCYDGRTGVSSTPGGSGIVATKGTNTRNIKGNDLFVPYTFCVSATDPRGNVTTVSHDEKGNPTNKVLTGHSGRLLESDGAPIQLYTYDTHGQLTDISHAAAANGISRVDTFTWSQGQVTECVVDAAVGGLAITSTFEYDERGNLTRCVDPRGNDWLFTYNSLDQCVRAQSPVNVSARCSTGFFYDANDNLVQTVTQVRSASDALVGTCTDRASYDTLSRLTEVALAVDATHTLTNRFVYDGNDQCVQVLGGDAVSGVDPHHAVAFAYDTCGLLYREIAAPGSADACTTQYDYDPNGLLTRVSEGLEETPSITTLAYDGFAREAEYEKWEGVLSVMGAKAKAWMVNNRSSSVMGQKAKAWMVNNFERVSQITDPMGNVTTFHYDENDNLTVARQFGQTLDAPGSDGNIRLAETRYEYDDLDRCAAQRELHFSLAAPQSPVGDGECTTSFAYAPNGACTSITNDVGLVTVCEYDTAGRAYRIRKVDKGPVITTATRLRDAAGNVTSVTQTDTSALGGPPQSFTRTFAYDSRNRCTSTTDGAGKTDACAYDSLNRMVRSTDAAGTQTFHSYDLLGRRTLTVGDLDGDGVPEIDSDITETASWSPSNGRLLSTTDSHANTTSYDYDSQGRCTTVTQADGTQEQLVWSPRSNLLQETDAKGTVSVCTYDPNDRLTRRDITTQSAGGGGGSGGALYFETFLYDGCDRLVEHRDDDCDGDFAYDSLGDCVSETLNGLTTASTYDALGNRLSLTYPSGRVLAYAYDASGGCTNITESGVSLASFDYIGADRLARVTYGNGLHSSFEYDGLDGVQNDPGDHGFGQVSHVVHASTNGTTVKISHLSWDLKENKAARIIPPTGTGVSTNVLTLEYDLADRLVHATVTDGTTTLRDTTYGLDRMGNRTNVTGAACSGPYTLDLAVPPADYQMNQYTATPCDSRSYDDNGNLLSRTQGTGSPRVFTYDYADRLVSVSDAGQTVASYTYDALGRRASKTSYNNDPPQPTSRILRMVHANDRVIEEWEDNTVVASYVLMRGDGNILQLSRSGAHYFVLADDQGNAELLTDASGAVVEGYDYDDYGAVTFLTSDGTPTPATSSAFGNPYCWGGLRLDAETGLHNDDGGVYFDSTTGRSMARRESRTGRNPQTGKTIQIKATMTQGGESPPSVASKHYITIPHDLPNIAGSAGNNPWSGGSPLGMKKGTVKFFNDAKGFGRANQEKLDLVLNLIR